jgi:hypothetical protein
MLVQMNKPGQKDVKEDKKMRVSVTFSGEQYKLLIRLARQKRVSTAWVVRDAVERYLDQEIKPLRTE